MLKIPTFELSGNLPPGIHWATWDEFSAHFGTNPHRQWLLAGLKAALDALKPAGCRTVYVGGSFVTAREVPGDYDACWDVRNVDPALLDPLLLPGRRREAKAKYYGDILPNLPLYPSGVLFVEFLQIDKQTGQPRGIVAIDLEQME